MTVWHYMSSPGVAWCRADYPDMAKTVDRTKVTCLTCSAAPGLRTAEVPPRIDEPSYRIGYQDGLEGREADVRDGRGRPEAPAIEVVTCTSEQECSRLIRAAYEDGAKFRTGAENIDFRSEVFVYPDGRVVRFRWDRERAIPNEEAQAKAEAEDAPAVGAKRAVSDPNEARATVRGGVAREADDDGRGQPTRGPSAHYASGDGVSGSPNASEARKPTFCNECGVLRCGSTETGLCRKRNVAGGRHSWAARETLIETIKREDPELAAELAALDAEPEAVALSTGSPTPSADPNADLNASFYRSVYEQADALLTSLGFPAVADGLGQKLEWRIRDLAAKSARSSGSARLTAREVIGMSDEQWARHPENEASPAPAAEALVEIRSLIEAYANKKVSAPRTIWRIDDLLDLAMAPAPKGGVSDG